MIICSWDVGIIHLAYCVMEYYPSAKLKYKIKDWNQIDLTSHNHDTCCGIGKNNQKCNRKAAYMIGFDECDEKPQDYGDHTSYCRTHINSCLNTFIPYQGDSQSCQHVYRNKEKKCNDKVTYYLIRKVPVKSPKGRKIKHKLVKTFFCTKHKACYDYPSIVPIKNKGANKIPIEELQVSLLKKLESMPQLLKVDRIVIENQPSLKNPRMKAIASTLYNFFLMRSTIDRIKYECSIDKVLFMSPCNKLKVNKENVVEVIKREKAKGKDRYKLTKELAIEYCKQMLKNCDKKHYEFLLSNKKQDDLSDCYLQGCYYFAVKMNQEQKK